MNLYRIGSAVATLLIVLSAHAQEVTQTQLPSNHPLVGTWRIELPEQMCFEEYEVRADGIKLSRSAEERNESVHSISLVPSSNGFYKWVDKIVKNNGKPDCSGAVGSSGHVAVNFIRLHPSGQRMLLCEAEDMNTCYAEFNRTQ